MLAMTRTEVLVVGAGPTGLMLACDLARRGVAVRIVDRGLEFPHGSRGKGLSPRSLEVFDDLGVIDRLLKSGLRTCRIASTGARKSSPRSTRRPTGW